MLNDAEKRAALLAVSWYGADPTRIYEVVRSVLDERARGDRVDLLKVFHDEKLLSTTQIRELRTGLDKTVVQPVAVAGAGKRDLHGLETILPGEDAGVEESAVDTDEEIATPFDLTALGDYRILRRLGEGGTGTVFLAYHAKENRQVALKVLSRQLAKNQATLDRFYREAKSGALLNHPHIVRCITVGQDKATDYHYLVMEYVDGPSGLDLLDQYGRLSVGDAAHVILDIARGLEHAHSRNVIHRDIKPGNILITTSGIAKLADMGLAKRTDETSHLTHAKQGFGTPYYMPYEQGNNAKHADARSDIFALGATFYHLVTGALPFPGGTQEEIFDKKEVGDFEPASSVNPDVPRALDDILARMMAREPRKRYQTVSQFIVDLERANLAGALPSFVDPDVAMEDPVVRQRLSAPASTCLDLRDGVDRPKMGEDIWYVRYKDRHGEDCKARMTSRQVRERLRAGKFSPHDEAARKPRGDFKSLTAYDEFREALTPAAGSKSANPAANGKPARSRKTQLAPPTTQDFRPSRLGWWIALAAGVGIVLLTIVTLVLWLRPS